MENLKILCVIPARSGSKGIPHKNIKKLKNIPLMAWSILQAQKSKYRHMMKIIVSTDSEEYASIAREYGAETPFLRPENISKDNSTDLELMKHCLEFLDTNDNYKPDLVLQLRPTQPDRKVSDIDKCISLFLENIEKYDSLRTVVPFDKSAFKMYTIDKESNTLKPLFNFLGDMIEPYNQCRQYLPTCYLHNGYIDIFKPYLVDNDQISGDRILPYVMNEKDTIDIDTFQDWEKAENIFEGLDD